MTQHSELEIARLAKKMEADYLEQFGADATQPDFIASAKLQLRNDYSLTGLTSEQLDVAIEAINAMGDKK